MVRSLHVGRHVRPRFDRLEAHRLVLQCVAVILAAKRSLLPISCPPLSSCSRMENEMEVVSAIYKRWQYEARLDPEAFWARAAREVYWFRTWDRVLEWEPPTFRWFTGATTNISHNCLDLQVQRGNGGRTALIAEHEDGSRRLFTYAQMLAEVKRLAAA